MAESLNMAGGRVPGAALIRAGDPKLPFTQAQVKRTATIYGRG